MVCRQLGYDGATTVDVSVILAQTEWQPKNLIHFGAHCAGPEENLDDCLIWGDEGPQSALLSMHSDKLPGAMVNCTKVA